MVGEGVLIECLNHANVEQVLVINRKPGGLSHPKLCEIIHADFLISSALNRNWLDTMLVFLSGCFIRCYE
ncbi:hypothetical protein [Parachlamydia acanthamoebae]|uniref:hypothetical protein n=1 Tax=Parachlamydia acanthamoebae TaxID=83552 RepID=UPI0005803902|nr:hypothetical protein [Parachlamydia acanthamoebae]